MATEIERETVPIKTQTLETLPYSLPGPTEDQPLSPVKPDESKKTEGTTAVATVPATTDSPPVSNEALNSLQKKMRRAERFGVRVQLSEKEKRNSRAHRFGMGVSSNGSNALKNSIGSDALKRSEELKRKVRAERFGLPVQSVVDEEVKKKARLARFASVPKTGVEDDKRKARAIRFFTNSSCPSTSDGEANSQKETVAGVEGNGVA